MWPALLLPVVVLAGTLFMERFETAVLAPKSGRAKPAASTQGQTGKSLLWTMVVPPTAYVSRSADRSHSVPEALPSAGDAELEVSSGAVTG